MRPFFDSNPDPYTKWATCRVVGTPALQSDPAGLASRTPREDACRFLEDSCIAIPCARFTNVHPPPCQALDRHSTAPHMRFIKESLLSFFVVDVVLCFYFLAAVAALLNMFSLHRGCEREWSNASGTATFWRGNTIT